MKKMAKSNKKVFNILVLIVEFSAFAVFTFLTYRLYYALTHQTPIPPEKQLDNDFVPLVLLFLLFVGACVFGLVFFIHFSVWLIKRLKENREAANRLS